MILEVIAAAPSVREAALAREGVVGPQPGSVFLARAPGGELYVCAGYLPCGKCGPCQAALHSAGST